AGCGMRWRSWSGCAVSRGWPQLAEAPRYPGSIVLVDVGGTSLAGLAKPLAVDDLLALAVQLAATVARMHRRGVMHRHACEHRDLARRRTVPGGLRVGDIVRRDSSRFAPHRRWFVATASCAGT